MKKSLFKRMTAFAAASALAVSTVMSSMAAIYIIPNEHTYTGYAERYEAYQIFTGTLDTMSTVDIEVDHSSPLHGDMEAEKERLPLEDFVSKYAEKGVITSEELYAAAIADGEGSFESGFSHKTYPIDGNEEETYDDYLESEYDYYLEQWEASHTMIGINWGSALLPAGDLDEEKLATIKGLLYKLATTDWDGDGEWHHWEVEEGEVEAPVEGAENDGHTSHERLTGVEASSATLIEAAFAEIYDDFLNDMEDADIIVEEDEKAEAYSELSRKSAVGVAKVISCTYDFGKHGGEGDFHEGFTRINKTMSGKAPVIDESAIDVEFLQKFAAIVANAGLTNAFVSTDTTLPTTNSEGWKIDVDEVGYYLIIDKLPADKLNANHDAMSPYFMDVFAGQDMAVFVKSNAPVVDKTIEKVNGEEENIDGDKETAVAEIGSRVTYQLAGTLPENFSYFYDSYYYRFSDLLSSGLTLDETSIKVSVVVNAEYGELVVYDEGKINNAAEGDFHDILDDDNFSVMTKKYVQKASEDGVGEVETNEAAYVGKSKLFVTFTDLRDALYKALKAQNEDFNANAFNAIKWDQAKVLVTYDAIINSDAVIKPAVGDTLNGNDNTVHVTYTNDPNANGEGKEKYDPEKENPDTPDPEDPDYPEEEDPNKETKTPTTKDTVTVYVFGAELTKLNEEMGIIDGAEFELTNDEGKTAVFYKTDKIDPNTNEVVANSYVYTLLGWKGEETLAQFVIDNAKLLSEALPGVTLKVESNVVTTMVSGDDGMLGIKGLGSGKYIFEETKAPKGYKSVKTFVVNLVAEYVIPTKDDFAKTLKPTNGEEITTWDDIEANLEFLDFDDAEAAYDAYIAPYLETKKFTGKLFFDSVKDGNNAYYPGGEGIKDQGTRVEYTGNVENASVSLTENVEAVGTYIALNVVDPSASALPGTGGSGVYLYYIFGGLLIAGAISILVAVKKKKKTQA